MRLARRKERSMLHGPLFSSIITYTIPIMLTGLLQLLFNAADIIVVGQYAGNTALAAVGATFPERVSQAILPSCINGFLSWFLYCIEVNIRASTIVGMVGGGGVGLTLFSYIKGFKYDIAFSIILLIAVMVIVVDRITGKLRKEINK